MIVARNTQFITKVQTDVLPNPYPGRLVLSSLLTRDGHTWYIIALYAYARNTKREAYVEDNNKLLFDYLKRLYLSLPTNRCIIAGDFNVQYSDQPILFNFLSQCCVDVAMHAHRSWQVPLSNTAYGTSYLTGGEGTRIDQIWVSKNDIQMVTDFSNTDFDRSSAHKGLLTVFRDDPVALETPSYRQPKQLPVKTIPKKLLKRIVDHDSWFDFTYELDSEVCSLLEIDKNQEAYDILNHKLETKLISMFNNHAGTRLDEEHEGRGFVSNRNNKTDKEETVRSTRCKQYVLPFPSQNRLINWLGKQVRRLDEALRKWSLKQFDAFFHDVRKILRSQHDYLTFDRWIHSNLEFYPLVFHCYDFSTLVIIRKAVVAHINRAIKRQITKRRRANLARLQQDWLDGGSVSYSMLRKPSNEIQPLLVKINSKPLEVVVKKKTKKQPDIIDRLYFKQDIPVHDSTLYVRLDGELVEVCGYQEKCIMFQHQYCAANIPKSLDIYQWAVLPQHLAQALHDSWQDIWYDSSLVRQEDYHDNTFYSGMAEHMTGVKQDSVYFSYSDWVRVIKNWSSTRGPDSWAFDELRLLPERAVAVILQFINHLAYTGQGWPESTMLGVVTMIPKSDEAVLGTDYRPITVLPTLYRIWAKMYYDKLMAWFSPGMHKAVKGMVPSSGVLDILYDLALKIEVANVTNVPTIGGVIDIVKCFNNIPRSPVFWLLKQAGADEGAVNMWSRSYDALRRVVKIGKTLSNEAPTNIGFPEGDPLSVFVIIVIGHCYARSLDRFDGVETYVYADNFEFLSNSVDEAFNAMHATISFVKNFGMEVSFPKSWFWAAPKQTRRQVRKMIGLEGELNQVKVVNHAKDLGAELSYIRQNSRATLDKREDKFKATLHRLRKLPHSLKAKVRMVRQAALPQLLWGAQIVHYTSNDLSHYRTKILEALKLQRSGTNPYLNILVNTGAFTDPEFVVHRTRIMSYRNSVFESSTPNVIVPPLSTFGPIALLQRSMTDLGWLFSDAFTFLDHNSRPHSWALIPLAELELLAHEAWISYVVKKVNSRKYDDVSNNIDVISLKTLLREYGEQDQTILRLCFSLGVFESNMKNHISDEGIQCAVCGVQDSLRHKYWECPRTSACRGNLNLSDPRLSGCPNFLLLRGVPTLPPSVNFLREYLQDIPYNFPNCWPSTKENPLMLFVDGTASPTDKIVVRLAAYSVVSLDSNIRYLGQVQGPLQTIQRAETLAALTAVRMAKFVHVVSDSAYVVKGIRKLLKGKHLDIAKMANHDLWGEFKAEVLSRPEGCISVTKIKSHQRVDDVSSPYLQMLIEGNNLADQMAKLANLQRPVGIITQWVNAQTDIQTCRRSCVLVWDVLLKTNKYLMDLRPGVENNYISPSKVCPERTTFPLKIVLPLDIPHVSCYSFTHTWAKRLLLYLDRLRWPETETGRPVTLFEILVDYIFSTNSFPPFLLRPPQKSGSGYEYGFWDKSDSLKDFYITWTKLLQTFTSSIHALSVIIGHNVLPFQPGGGPSVTLARSPETGETWRLTALDRNCLLLNKHKVDRFVQQLSSGLDYPRHALTKSVLPFNFEDDAVKVDVFSIQVDELDPHRIALNQAKRRREGHRRVEPSNCEFTIA